MDLLTINQLSGHLSKSLKMKDYSFCAKTKADDMPYKAGNTRRYFVLCVRHLQSSTCLTSGGV